MSPPWLDRVIGDRTGDVLAWLAKRAKKRGDAHEFAHLYGAIVFGNSQHDGDWPCGLGYVEGYLSARGGEHRVFEVVLRDPSQTSVQVDALMADRPATDSAPQREVTE